MTISYNWISEYIPVRVEPERLSNILTSIGLEVESMERYESIRGGLEGLVVGEVKEKKKHPGADKLSVTQVDTGDGKPVQIVCGAPNVEAGQKVVVARPGVTIFPLKGEPFTLKTARIRGEESFGMICAEDEIGIGESHEGILVLPAHLVPGTKLSEHFPVHTDHIFEIGLTPNRMDAMSHYGVARDVCAWLSVHDKKDIRAKDPYASNFRPGTKQKPFAVSIENTVACQRYTGVLIGNITVKESPRWLQEKLRAIGQRPINNIVDITNYILHDTGQPLHAFDAGRIAGNSIIVKNLSEGTSFTTLDEKERKLRADDLMICDGNGKGLCIAGVFGGRDSGVGEATKTIFLESAWFNPIDIRKTSFHHGLRTDAAMRFEKNVDISNTLNVLKRAAALIAELAGGEVISDVTDVYPNPAAKTEVTLRHYYLKKISGKIYHPDTSKKILQSLGFEIVRETTDDIRVAVPYSKPDVTLPADLAEEIMRIDGYDNIDIPSSITISPAAGAIDPVHIRAEKTAGYLVGAGFNEIFTNSITNAAYFSDAETDIGVKLLNNLSAVHNIMRPSMLETGLEAIGYNLNRKNPDLRFFEFGKTYHSHGAGKYDEQEHLCLYVTGNRTAASWKNRAITTDIYYLKGLVEAIPALSGISNITWQAFDDDKLSGALNLLAGKEIVASIGAVSKHERGRFDIRQDVYFADIRWKTIQEIARSRKISFVPLPNQLPVYRDLALVVDQSVAYENVVTAIRKTRTEKLRSVELFDVFESEKLGAGKKSFAISLTFLDEEKTLTDKEIDSMMNKIMKAVEQDVKAAIRKGA